MANGFDLTVDGTSAKIARGVEGSFRERSVRAEITQNVLSQAENAGLVSRPDQPSLYQSDWSGGSRWWKPIIRGDEQTSYFTSTNLDLWSEPGSIVPLNKIETQTDDTIPRAWAWLNSALYAVDLGNDSDTTGFYDVAVWTPASDGWTQDTGQHSGVPAGADETPDAAVGDPSDGYVYVLNFEGSEIVRFSPGSNAEDAAWISQVGYVGSNIFLNNGFLMFYNGDQVYTIDKSGPSATSVFNDGMGPDASRSEVVRGMVKRAVASPEGIYYVKNVHTNNPNTAYVFRVDRDEAGNWIGNPIATLPSGMIALSITYHLGSILITATTRPVTTFSVQFEGPVIIYHITQGSLGTLGSIEGNKSFPDSPFMFLGASGALLYLGGSHGTGAWIYDAAAGGLHRAHIFPSTFGGLDYGDMALVQDSAGAYTRIFNAGSQKYMVNEPDVTDPDTVTAFGDDETFYTLESNYFDMNLPMELKDITKVALMCDAATTASRQEWTLQISTDDASFTDVLTHSAVTQYAEASITPGTHRGRLFRYKLIYQTKDAIKRALRAVLITANAGQMVREWELVLDGTSLMNVNNEPLRPAAFAEAMRATAAKETAISVVFDYQSQDASADTGETVNVKVQECIIDKPNPDEAYIHLTLREV